MGQVTSNPQPYDTDIPPAVLSGRNLSSVAEYISSGRCQNIVFLVGAGISTAAGIPDFRSPSTGLYTTLSQLDLPHPEAVFEISYFVQNPQPFYSLASELWPSKFQPTMTHRFMTAAHRRGHLLRVFTQNFDTLELAAGVPREKIVFAHGSFADQHCAASNCRASYPRAEFEDHVRRGEPAACKVCGGWVKPDITFFGEALPPDFHESITLLGQADLVVVMGSSLSVHPFAALPQRVAEGVPRVLLNMEKVGDLGSRREDVVWLGECDDGVRELAEKLGWWEEIEKEWKVCREAAAKEAEERRSARTLEEEVEALTKEVEKGLMVAEKHRIRVSEGLDRETRETQQQDRGGGDGGKNDKNKISPDNDHHGDNDDGDKIHVVPHPDLRGKDLE